MIPQFEAPMDEYLAKVRSPHSFRRGMEAVSMDRRNQAEGSTLAVISQSGGEDFMQRPPSKCGYLCRVLPLFRQPGLILYPFDPFCRLIHAGPFQFYDRVYHEPLRFSYPASFRDYRSFCLNDSRPLPNVLWNSDVHVLY